MVNPWPAEQITCHSVLIITSFVLLCSGFTNMKKPIKLSKNFNSTVWIRLCQHSVRSDLGLCLQRLNSPVVGKNSE